MSFKKKLIVPVLTATLMATFVLNSFAGEKEEFNTSGASANLLFAAEGGWRATTDDLGSSFETREQLIQDSTAKVTFTMAKKGAPDEWPYVELICALGRDIDGVHGLEITYKCDKPLTIKLSQTEFGYYGNQTYSHYEFILPASEEDWNTERVKISQFRQPSWAPAKSREIPLKLQNVEDVYLVPNLNYNTGDKGTLEVKNLILYGFETAE